MKCIKLAVVLAALVTFFNLTLAAGPAAAAAVVTNAPAVGPPTTKITVSGTGFGLQEAVDVYFDTTDMLLVATDTTGKFTGAVIKVPKSAEPGKHWITAVGRSSGKAAQKAFTVRTNWAQFRRVPQHLGLNPFENVLNPYNVSGLYQAWAAPTGSNIESSPAVANGVVYVGSDDKKLYAFNAATGATMPGFPVTTGNSIFSSPAVANGVVYVGSTDGNLYAFNASTGDLLFAAATGYIYYSSPAVADGTVYVGSLDGSLYAYNLDAGYLGSALKAQRAAAAQPPDPAHLVPNYSLEPVPSSEKIEE